MRCIQIAAALYRVFKVSRFPGVEVLHLLGEVHCVSTSEYRVSRAKYVRSYSTRPPNSKRNTITVKLFAVKGAFTSLRRACEALL